MLTRKGWDVIDHVLYLHLPAKVTLLSIYSIHSIHSTYYLLSTTPCLSLSLMVDTIPHQRHDQNATSDLRPGDVVLVPFHPLFDPDNSVYSTASSATLPSAIHMHPSFPSAEEKLRTSPYHYSVPGIVVGTIPTTTATPSPFLPVLRLFPYWRQDAPGPNSTPPIESDQAFEVENTFKDATVMVQLLTHMDITLPFPIDRLVPWAAFDTGALSFTITRSSLSLACTRVIAKLNNSTGSLAKTEIEKDSVELGQNTDSSRAWLRIYRAWWIALVSRNYNI